MATRDLISYPCEDACGTIVTDRTFEGAPIYRCPGCDTEWIELDQRTDAPNQNAPAPETGSEGVQD